MVPPRRRSFGSCASHPAARLRALEERLKRVAREEGVDLQRLRRQVAFDRFLARLFPSNNADWVLKGGYAMELRFQTARATRDLDFTAGTAQSMTGAGLLKQLQDAGAKDVGDVFRYRIGDATMDLDGAPYGGARYPVESIMGGRTFVKFHLDVGVGDVVLDPPEYARMRDWPGFAGIAAPDVPMIQREQQFAEKLHVSFRRACVTRTKGGLRSMTDPDSSPMQSATDADLPAAMRDLYRSHYGLE